MTLLLLLRHALTDTTGHRLTGTTPGIHLSERGRAQAEALGERMSALRLHALYASPLERCAETAAPIAARQGLPVVPLPEVGEVEFGGWTGRSLSQLSRTRLWRMVQSQPSRVRFPGGEAIVEVQARAVLALEALSNRRRPGTVAVVTHAEVIRLAIAHFAGVPVDLFQRIQVSPASLSAVLLDEGRPRILRLNDTGDLADLAPPRGPRTGGRSGRGLLPHPPSP